MRARDWPPIGLVTWRCLDTSGGDVSAEWRAGSLAEEDDKDDAWAGIEGGEQRQLFREVCPRGDRKDGSCWRRRQMRVPGQWDILQ